MKKQLKVGKTMDKKIYSRDTEYIRIDNEWCIMEWYSNKNSLYHINCLTASSSSISGFTFTYDPNLTYGDDKHKCKNCKKEAPIKFINFIKILNINI